MVGLFDSGDRRTRSVAPDTAPSRAAAKAAQKYLTESKLHRFVEDSNIGFEVAPVTPVVITGCIGCKALWLSLLPASSDEAQATNP